MSDTADVPAGTEEFNVHEAQLIVLMRLYDIGMALLQIEKPGMADKLYQAHKEGRILGPMPSFRDTDDL